MGANKFAQRGGGPAALAEYKFYTEFQSHEPEFDYLKSLEIEEKVRRVDRGEYTVLVYG
jgi:serine/threonine-protein phosphatase 2A regulatory subunit B